MYSQPRIAIYGPPGTKVDVLKKRYLRKGYVILKNKRLSAEDLMVYLNKKNYKKVVILLKTVEDLIAAKSLKYSCIYLNTPWLTRFKRITKKDKVEWSTNPDLLCNDDYIELFDIELQL